MGRRDGRAKQWYPELTRLASHSVEEVRNTDAWVMGQDTSVPAFHETLSKMLQDQSPVAGANEPLSLFRSGASSGRPYISALPHPPTIASPTVAAATEPDKPETATNQGGS